MGFGNPAIFDNISSVIASQGLTTEDYLTFSKEMYFRLRRLFVLVFLTTMGIAFTPISFFKGHFTFANYSPSIYMILSTIIDFAVSRMLHNNQVQIMVTSPMTIITICIQLALIVSAIVNVPIIAIEFYRFAAPGLYPHEQVILRNAFFQLAALFVLGFCVSFFFVLPITLSILTTMSIPFLNYGSTPMTMFFSLDSIFSITIWTVVYGALLYMLPGVIYLLVVLKILDVKYLVKNRKHVILVILIFAAVITPDPTMISMVIISGPLILIQELIITRGLQLQADNNNSMMSWRFDYD